MGIQHTVTESTCHCLSPTLLVTILKVPLLSTRKCHECVKYNTGVHCGRIKCLLRCHECTVDVDGGSGSSSKRALAAKTSHEHKTEIRMLL